MENKVRKKLLLSGYVGFATLFLMIGLLYTPFFEFGEYKVSSYDYFKRDNPFPVFFTSDIYPIPFTDMYNVRTHDGWCYLDLSNTDTKDITFPRDKGFNMLEYCKKYGDMRLYVRRVDYGAIPYFLFFSTLLSLVVFITLFLRDKVNEYLDKTKSKKEDDEMSEYTLLR